jgi:hypothetical protein
MGREIRRVPENWQHPKNDNGHFKPLYDRSFEEAAAQWKENFRKWESGEDPDHAAHPEYEFWEWEGDPPNREYYRPAWKSEEATCYQIYETVSEGTPTSPVFRTRTALRDWLTEQGFSIEAASRFAEEGWAPSMVLVSSPEGREMHQGIEALTHMPRRDD